MSSRNVERIARTLLYEGYMLYPYRPSAVKNRQRFNFGVLYPPMYATTGVDASALQTECLVRGDASSKIDVKIRCLRLAARTVGRVAPPSPDQVNVNDARVTLVDRLDVDGRLLQTWEDGAECEVTIGATLRALLSRTCSHRFAFPDSVEVEQVPDRRGMTAAILVRRTRTIAGELRLSARHCAESLFSLRVVVENQTTDGVGERPEQIVGAAVDDSSGMTRDDALLSSMIATHAIVTSPDAQFVSLTDPPDEARVFARECVNIGAWPVLVGEEGAHDAVLASPIIVNDYPALAAESPGDFFDATEMDEMLSLRILTLTDDEKREMTGADDRSRALLERTQCLAAEQMMQLHGVMRPVEAAGGAAH